MTFQPPPPPPGPPGGPPPGGPPQGPPGGTPPPPPPGPPPAVSPGQPFGQAPTGPPPSQWGPPAGQPGPGGAFDPKTVNPLDWGIVGAGVLAFIFSFVSYYTFSEGGFSVSENAWHGFFGWFAMLLAVVGSAAIALELFMPHVKLPFPNRLIALAAYALAALCVIIALFVTPSYLGIDVPDSVDEGHGFGYWVSLIVILAGLVLSFMRFQQTGGKLPIGPGASRPGPGGPPPAGPPR